jgi:DNA-binding transcriptional ArsR family regulator
MVAELGVEGVMRLSKIFASSCRQNILRILSKHGEIHIMKLVKEVKSTYLEVDRNLRLLEGAGIITLAVSDRDVSFASIVTTLRYKSCLLL